MSHGASSGDPSQSGNSALLVNPGAPPPPHADAPAHEHEAYWYRHVYKGDDVPQLTFRAIAMGAILGMLMSISNLYTTLKVGWSFGVVVTASVMSFVIWNAFRALTFKRISQMSILENNCMASAASGAGYSTGSTLATMFGAMLLLEAGDPKSIHTWSVQNWKIVAVFTLCTAALGVFLAIPLKRQMVNRERLAFPTGIAAAVTLKSLYSEGREAILKAYSLIIGLVGGVVVGVMNTPANTYKDATNDPDNLPKSLGFVDTQLFGKLPELVPENGFAQLTQAGRLVQAEAVDGKWSATTGLKLPAFGFEPSGLLVAAGMIVGLRVSLSMTFGSILLYTIVGPWIVSMDDPTLPNDSLQRAVKITGGGSTFQLVHWALWGGTAVMVFSSLTAVALQWKTLARAFMGFGRSNGPNDREADVDAIAKRIEVPLSWLIAGLVPISIAMLFVQYIGFHINPFLGAIAIAMAFVLSMVAARATGETDTTPIGAMGKVMQLLFAVLAPGKIVPNLASAGVAANSASSASDLLTDLKGGYLLGANPRRQFLAQFIGIFFGTLSIVPAWYLLVPTKEALEKYPLPATRQWEAVARVLTEGVHNLPMSARYAIFIGAMVGIVLPIIDRLAPKKLRAYLPSAMGLGLSWVMPFTNAFAFGVGAVIAWVWSLIHRRTHDRYNIPLASGIIAGESLLKALIAMSATAVGLLTLKSATGN